MCYVKPDLVVSPKSLVSNLKVIYDGEEKVGHWLKWNGVAQKPLCCAGMVVLKIKDSRELEILNPEACLPGLFFPKKLRKLLSVCSR